jgi:hypothetical protein
MTNDPKVLKPFSSAQNIKKITIANLPSTAKQKVIRNLELPNYYCRLIKEAAKLIAIEEAELTMWLSYQEGITPMNAMTLCLAITQYGLNPFLGEIIFISQKEIFQLEAQQADPPPTKIPFITIAGWNKIINAHPQFCGIQFIESTELQNGNPSWIECLIMRRDRDVPIIVREYLMEAKTEKENWQIEPIRMLRYKVLVQCARLAFGISMPQGNYLQSPVISSKQTCKLPAKSNWKKSNTVTLKHLLNQSIGQNA